MRMNGGIPRAAVRRWRTARELPCGDLIDSCPTDTDKRCKILSARALEGFFVCRNGRACPVRFSGTCRGCDAMGYEILLRLSGARCAGLWEFPCACRSVARLYYEILRCSSGCGWSDAASFPVEVRRNWRCGFAGACRSTSHLGCGNSLAFAEVRLYRRCDGSGGWLAVVAA